MSILDPPGDGVALAIFQFRDQQCLPHQILYAHRDNNDRELLKYLSIDLAQLPIAICPNHKVLHSPSVSSLADALGLSPESNSAHVFDAAIIGAGPAGLATAVYAASEGLSTIVVDGLASGGQAGTSSRIENYYLGFPTGISGQDLANSALMQSQRFGAQLVVSRKVVALVAKDGRNLVVMSPTSYRLLYGSSAVAAAIGNEDQHWAVTFGCRYCRARPADHAAWGKGWEPFGF